MVSPRFHITDDVMAYARVATGYRPGGPNVGVAGVPPQVDADTLVNYEIGLKSELLDRRAMLDVAVFYIDWSDIQITVVDPATNISYNANAGSARSRGVELTSTYSPVNGLTFGLNASYTDAILTSDLPANAPPLGWRDGDRLPYAPRWNASATVDYAVPLTGTWSAQFDAGYRYIGDRYSDPPGYPLAVRMGDYRVFDASAAVSDERWTVRLYARNLTDERAYLSSSIATEPLSGALDHIEATILQPRTIGLSVDLRF
jgi:outer membrane receptor protein involved in Fe transport